MAGFKRRTREASIAYAIAVYACSTPTKKPDAIQVITYDRASSTAPSPTTIAINGHPPTPLTSPTPDGPLMEGVEFLPSLDEYWARPLILGERVDLMGSIERADAEAAVRIARDLLSLPRPVTAPRKPTWQPDR